LNIGHSKKVLRRSPHIEKLHMRLNAVTLEGMEVAVAQPVANSLSDLI